MQHLGQVGVHPLAHPCGENDDVHGVMVAGRPAARVGLRRTVSGRVRMASQCAVDGNVDTEVEKKVLSNSANKSGWRRPLRGLPARMVALLAVSILVTACNTLKLGYEQLPRIVEWQVDRFLALDSDQEALVN